PTHHAGAILHAGWRGTAQQIAAEGVRSLQNTHGSNPSEIIAVIGPSIEFCCFQVSMEVAETLAQAHSLSLEAMQNKGLLAFDADFPHNPRVNLKGLNAWQLKQAGVTQIDLSPHCT